MAGIKIDSLPPVVTPALSDVFPIDQAAVTYKETAQQLMSLFEANIVITPSNFSGTLPVTKGGTTNTSFTAYSVIAGGTTATGALQSIVGLGTAGQQLTSNGVGALPTWQSGGGNPLTTKGDLFTFTTVDARLPVGTINGQYLQVNSGTATGLAWSTATLPATATNVARILRSDATNWVESTSTFADTYTASSFLYANGANNVAGLATANNGLPVTSNTGVPSILAGPGTTGNFLQSNAAAAPSWSTATFPSVGGTSGNILISNGTNYIASTSLWPNTVGTSGKFIISDGTTNGYSTSTIPTSAGATANKLLLSDGTNYVLSTPTFPNASATTGKIIISDGTNWIASTPTYPATASTSGNVLTSDGTNWLSSAPAASATSVIVDDTTTNATMYPTWVTASSGSLPLKVSSTKMSFNPSTGTMKLTGYISSSLGVTDSTGNVLCTFNYAASAVNLLTFYNNSTGNPVSIGTTGSDSLVPLQLAIKGGAAFIKDTAATTSASLKWYNAAGNKYTALTVATAQATDLLLTLPAADGSAKAPLVTNGSGVLSFGTLPINGMASQTFTSSGTYTPTTGMVYCIIECVGGGGGGGGCAQSTGMSSGGGGGSGSYSRSIAGAATVGASQTITIGAAGSAGSAGNNAGGAGGATSCGTICIGNGGAGGGGAAANSQSLGGAAGTPGTGNVITPYGNAGDNGIGGSISTFYCNTGAGGASVFGGRITATQGTINAGTAANPYGAGGGGGNSVANNAPGSGGVGYKGVCIITEFLCI